MARNCRECPFGFTTASPATSDIKSATTAFDQFMTGVEVRAEVPVGKIDGSF
jgi:hypothetical protein